MRQVCRHDHHGSPQGHSGRPERGRLPEGDRAPEARGGHLLPLPLHHRAHGVQAVVRQDGASGQARHRERGEGRHQVRAGALHQELYELDEEHPRLVHQPPAVVGPPDPGLVLRRLRRDCGRQERTLHLPQVRRHQAHPGPRYPRHLVLFRSVALQHSGLAQ